MSQLTFTGDGKEIAAALGHLSASIGKNSTLPILSCYALDLIDGQLIAKGTDLDVQHSIALPVSIESAGPGACAAAGLLTSLLARCNGDGARVTIAGGHLAIVAGGRKASMNVLPLVEFPATHPDFGGWVSLEGARLAAAIRGIAFATSTEETRYVLNGMYLSGDGLTVATDGRRLAQVCYTDADPIPVLAGVIVPNKSLAPIADLLERHPRVEVAGDASGICFRAQGESYFTKVIEGSYPNFKQVIPNFHRPVRVSVERLAMQKALAWAKLYRTSKDTSAKLTARDGHLTIEVFSPEIGEAEEVLPTVRDSGEMRVALNITYLEQMVNREGGDYFTLECEPETSDHNKGVVLGPLKIIEENEDFLGVLMPMRIAE